MTSLVLTIATALAEAYLSKRLGGVNVKLDSTRLVDIMGDRRAEKKFERLTAKEKRLRELLSRIRPAPQRGALAKDSLGRLGLITSETPVLVEYPGGEKARAWVGIQLGPTKAPGGPWSSRAPTVVAHVETLD